MINKWVMVVDDEVEMLERLDGLLKREHFAVIRAPTAELALHLIKSVRPDAFVLDVSLPDMDGIELCRVLRSTPHTASIPVVMLSPHNECARQQAAREAGVNQFLDKQLLPSALISALDGLLPQARPSNGCNGKNGNGRSNGHQLAH